MDKKHDTDYKHLRKEWEKEDTTRIEKNEVIEKNLDPGSEEAKKEADRLKDVSKDLRKDIKDNYKSYKKELKNSDDPLADEKISVAKEQSDEIRDKIKKGIERQRDELRGRDTEESINMGVYLQDPMYGGAFFPDPTFGGIYPSEIAMNEAINEEEINKDKIEESTE